MNATRPCRTLTHLLAVLSLLFLAQCSGGQSRNPMTERDRFAPCPDSPNCVSSLSEDVDHRIEPVRYQSSAEAARDRLLDVLRGLPRVRIVTSEPTYIHAEFTSAVFRFVDDVEFRIVEEDKVIHARSASRVGYYDFGANRRRVEEIRRLFGSGDEDG